MYAQEDKPVQMLRSVVVDYASGAPITYATVGLLSNVSLTQEKGQKEVGVKSEVCIFNALKTKSKPNNDSHQ